MADFRKWITVLFVLALFAGLASAQQTVPLQCTANGAVTPQIRAESYADLMGDIVITCQGGPQMANGSTVPRANIVVQVNAPVTSRLQSSSTRLSEALLLLDEPQSGLTPAVAGYGPAAPQVLCTTPSTGCVAYVRTTGSGINVAVDGATSTATAPNVYQGYLAADNRTITFFGVPILPPASAGVTRTLRITNVRINAVAVQPGLFGVAQVSAYVSTNASTSLPLSYPAQVIAGFVQSSLTTSVSLGGRNPFLQCVSTDGIVSTGTLTFTELFGTAFKTRVVPLDSSSTIPGTLTNLPSSNANLGSNQSIPGGVYQGFGLSNSESGLIYPISGSFNAGLADFGTRLKAIFTNIPAGISLYVNASQGSGTTSGVSAALVPSEVAPEFASAAAVPSGWQQLVPVAGSATATWEILSANANQLDTVTFDVGIRYTAATANGLPTAPSVGSAQLWYAPTPSSGAFTANTAAVAQTAAGAPIPRFQDPTTAAAPIVRIVVCQTALLWPYVVTGVASGFDTGIAIANTSKDPLAALQGGTAASAQTGSCNLYWYGQNYGSSITAQTTAITYGCDQTNAVAGACVGIGTTNVIAAGQTWASTASTFQVPPSGSTWLGYVIGVCNFQYAHGYAAITDIGVRNFVSSYLALILQQSVLDPQRGLRSEALNQ